MGQGESKPVIEWAREDGEDTNENDWFALLTQSLYVILNTHEEQIQHRPSDFSIENLIYTEDSNDLVQVELKGQTHLLPVRGWRVDYTNEDKIAVSVQEERDRMLYADLHVFSTSILNSGVTVPESIRRRLLLIFNPLLEPGDMGSINVSNDSYKHATTVARVLVNKTKEMAYSIFDELISKSRAIAESE